VLVKINAKAMSAGSNLLLFNNILNKFPSKYIRFAFAYGSGVFDQINNAKTKQTMIDLVFVVNDSIKFHDENLKLNSAHYSFLKYLGPFYLNKIQNEFGAACYYNTLVPIQFSTDSKKEEPFLIKYGVISEEALIRDLYDWDYLYMSGRLQKPVKIIKSEQSSSSFKTSGSESNSTKQTSSMSHFGVEDNSQYTMEVVNKSLELALKTNLKNALHTALLLMPEKFTLTELFICITALSYSGDFRMVIGENKNKCENIVLAQLNRFTELYKPYLIKESVDDYLLCNFDTGLLRQRQDKNTIFHHFNQLPKNLIQTIINLNFKTTHYYDLEEYIMKLTNRIDYRDIVSNAVKSIVQSSSLSQSAKGLLTAGFFKSLTYSSRKLQKMFK
jgi:translocator assembly and maintenance protein 41